MVTEIKITDAGPSGLLPRGNYSPTATYTLLHTVLYNHDSWVCKAIDQNGDAVEITGITPQDDSPYWQALTDGGRAAVAVGTQVRNDFDAWFGATANAGIRKIVADWLTNVSTQFTEWFSDSLPTGIRYIWSHWFSSTQTEWGTLKEDSTAATTRANNASAHAEDLNAHPPYIADGTQEKPGDVNFWYIWNHTIQQYVKDAYSKGDNLDLSTVTDAEQARLIEQIRQSTILATRQDGADIVTNYGQS